MIQYLEQLVGVGMNKRSSSLVISLNQHLTKLIGKMSNLRRKKNQVKKKRRKKKRKRIRRKVQVRKINIFMLMSLGRLLWVRRDLLSSFLI